MTRSSPSLVFEFAQRAMQAGDWETFFSCVRPSDLRSLAGMVMHLATIDPAAFGIAAADGVSGSSIDLLRCARDDVAESATVFQPGSPPVPDMLERSNAHRQLVLRLDAVAAAAVKEATDLPGFMAAMERHRRQTEGGGSVSSTLFVGDTISDIRIEGTRATATRRFPNGVEEPIGFEQRRGQWTIALGRPARR